MNIVFRKCVFIITMSLMTSNSHFGQSLTNTPVGFCAQNARGINTTTGGGNGRIISITNGDSIYTIFRNLRIDKNPQQIPTIVEIVGTLQVPDAIINIKTTANVTILGKGNNAKLVGGGLSIQQCQNMIIRNIEFVDCPDDAINIEFPETHHIWVDHCTFNDGANPDTAASSHDGALDIKRQATNITVSWCHFYNHSKTCLLGHSDSETADTAFTVTYHHNWFDRTRQRHPRVRYGKAHVFNNLYEYNDLYGVASTCEADVYMEANYFLSVPFPSYCGYANSPPGDLVSVNNVFSGSGVPQTRGTAFDPHLYYPYQPDDPNTLPSIIRQYAGSGKISFPSGVGNSDNSPTTFTLFSNYPNPFNPGTVIRYSIPEDGYVTLNVFDVLGNEVADLVSRVQSVGEHTVQFDGAELTSGVYVAVLSYGGKRLSQKMVRTK